MRTSTRRKLAASFGRDANDYAAARPGYPAAAVRWMLGSQPGDLLDLGAGTGALTRPAVAAGNRVVAADPSAAMLRKVAGVVPPAAAVQCAAEALPFGDETFDGVTVATAFHWFDAERALPEIARVLRAAGRLALAWNTRDERVPWVRRLGELLQSVQSVDLRGDWATGSVRQVADSSLFEPMEYTEFRFSQQLDRGDLLGLVASRSYVKELRAARREELLTAVRQLFDDEVASCSPTEPGGAHIWLPYRARCWRTTVAGAPESRD